MIETKDAVAEEVEDEDDDDLVDRLSKDHLDHVSGEEFCSTGIRFAIQQRY